jgi:DeoR/GlpR family transcriptional regulator of sugar metabolism
MDYDIDERKKKILELLSVNGKVKVSDLSKLFGISEVTIRIDLQDLEEKGLLERVHGGAISAYRPYYNMSFKQRAQTNQREKLAIAEKLCEYIKDNDTIMMNSGTTTLFAFRAISKLKNINIVTNSIAIALEAYSLGNINAILLGGSVNAKYQFTFGADAERQLKNYHADKCILSVDGVNLGGGISTFYKEEAQLCRNMIENSDKAVILADHTKIGRAAFVNIADISAADYIITSGKPTAELKELKENNINVIFA